MNKDDIFESPNKYGSWDDDLSELADSLAGRDVVRRDRVDDRTKSPKPDTVDEDFFSQTRDSNRKYGI